MAWNHGSTQRLARLVLGGGLMLGLVACEGETAAGPPPSTTAVGFVQLHRDFLVPSCASASCHAGPRGVGGLTFEDAQSAYDALLAHPPTNTAAAEQGLALVAPGDLARSFLYLKLVRDTVSLATAGHGARMPLGGAGAPGPSTTAALESWITGGAPYDGLGFEADFTVNDDADLYIPCDSTDDAGMRQCFPAADDGVMRIYSPPLTIPPRSEIQLCSYLDVFPDEDVVFRSMSALQMAGGHHSGVGVAFSAVDDPTPQDCTTNMTNMRFTAGTFAGQPAIVPESVVLRLPAGMQIVVQSHYINPTDEPMVVMDAVELQLVEDDGEAVRADSFAINYLDFEIPTGGEDYTWGHTCTVDAPMEVFSVLGHTHEHGVLLEFEHIPGGEADAARLLYSETDPILMREAGSVHVFETPLALEAGDQLRLSCTWRNDGDVPLGFPEEMCAAFMYYAPARGFLVCDEDGEISGSDDEEPAEGCIAPGAPGNAIGVGRYCTAGGGQCRDNPQATLCLANFDPAATFCSFLGCASDDDCGEGAACVAQSGASACVPDACLD